MGINKGILGIFQRAQGKHQDSLSNSFSYYHLTGREDFKVCTEGDAMVVTADHPHQNNTIFVFPEIGGNGDLTVDILNQLSHQKKTVELARYTQDGLDQLLTAIERARSSQIASISLKPETVMDWRYPVRIIDAVRIAHLDITGLNKTEKGEIRNLRNKYNKATKHIVRQIPIADPDAMRIMRASVLNWHAEMIMEDKETAEDMEAYYNTLLQSLSDIPNLDGFALELETGAGGFTIWEEQGDIANGLATLGGRLAPGLSEFHQIAACKKIAEKGITRYNMGGSEESSLDRFKLKFLPCESIEINTYTVNFYPRDVAPIQWHYSQ